MDVIKTRPSKHHFDLWVGGQRAIELVELIAAGRCNGDGHAQIFSAFALTQFDRTCVKGRVKFTCDCCNGLGKTVRIEPHDFDGKARGILNQRICAGEWRRFRRLGGVGH